VPAAPARFSITIDWPRCFSVAVASARIETSVEPPAGHGTMNVTGRVGNCCACAMVERTAMAAASSSLMSPSRAAPFFVMVAAFRQDAQRRAASQRRRLMAYWLLKTEPDAYSWDDQVKKGGKGDAWTGVRNFAARKNLQAMRKGDRAFFYHT